ncbi:hypothetical protein B5V03_40080 [Bradyrhizobium betae]|uniref:Uncharacterized protein n=1 Tax=Bradyrhizobium betae TaxID=244734 RepID=A0A4Q1UF78_9BRAD|nr:hypothetical protein B5V03_40080 [Bradyrhizobium betae]
MVDRGGLLQQSKLPIGDLGELPDGIRQRCGERRKPLAGAPAIPDVVAQQVGTSRHGRVARIAFVDCVSARGLDAYRRGGPMDQVKCNQ